MIDEWSESVPTEPGHYWMWGITNNIKIAGKGSKPRICLVKVTRSGSGSLMFVTEGQFLHPDIFPDNVWAPAQLPDPPSTEIQDS